MFANTRKFDYSKINVVDLEATCWDTRKGERPPRRPVRTDPDGTTHYEMETSEIIEIGICELDVKTGRRSNKQSILVKPVVSTVSEFCTELTGHTQEELDSGGLTFSEACLKLEQEYNSRNRIWASYGDYDRKMFDKQCGFSFSNDLKGYPVWKAAYPFSPKHINVKTIAALAQGRSKETGMKRCMENWYGLKLVGRHHNGADDAWNIGAILGSALGFNRKITAKEITHDYNQE